MKRKLALLLAAVMTLSMLPMKAFAASDNRLDGSPSSIPEKSVLLERGVVTDFGLPNSGSVFNNDDIKAYTTGSNLIITLKDFVKVGGVFRVELENAKWFFRGEADLTSGTAVGGIQAYSPGYVELARLQGMNTLSGSANLTNYYNVINNIPATLDRSQFSDNLMTEFQGGPATNSAAYKLASWEPRNARERWANNYTLDPTKYPSTYQSSGIDRTYRLQDGIWGYNTRAESRWDHATIGTYYRFSDRHLAQYSGANHGGRTAVPYKLEVSPSSDSSATVTILSGIGPAKADMTSTTGAAITKGDPVQQYSYDKDDYIVIPIVARTNSEADIKIRVVSDNLTTITTGTYLFGITSEALTNTYVKEPKTARENFTVDKLIIKETRIGSIKTTNQKDPTFLTTTGALRTYKTVQISAPSGFEFKDPNNTTEPVLVGLEKGLTWDAESIAASNTHPRRDGYGVRGSDYTINYKRTLVNNNSGYYGNNNNNTGNINIPNTVIVNNAVYEEDLSVLELTVYGVGQSTDISGNIYLDNVKFIAEEQAPWGDVMFKIRNVDSKNELVTNQTFKAGTRVDWTISLTTEGTIPELINGRYEAQNMVHADDEQHKTARVVFAENTANAWWAQRQTIFTLPEGIKFRKVEVDDQKNLEKPYGDQLEGQYINDGIRKSHVTIDGNTMTWTDLRVDIDSEKQMKTSKVKFDVWVSIESGHKGDVTLSVAGSAIPPQGSGNGEVPPVVIAKQISPVTVTSKVSDLKISYQYQETHDIIITETKAGNLLKNKQVRVSVTDLVSEDVAFSPDIKVAVTNGDLKIKSVNTSGSGWVGRYTGEIGVTGGTVTFEIGSRSTKASTMTLSNVSVKVDRTVPVTNDRPYQAVAWGSAIAPNYGPAKDQFTTPGIMTDYVKIVSSATDDPGVLSQEVRVIVGETYYTVNDAPVDMDAAAYISTTSNSTMVPVRFVANALGIRDNQVTWDDKERTVTIQHPSKTVQFKVGSSSMISNGVGMTMFSPDGLEVSPEIINERCYVPFRALGEAFGIDVDWDAATQTAIYNPGKNTAGIRTNETTKVVKGASEAGGNASTDDTKGQKQE